MNQRGRYRWMRRQTRKRCCDRRRRLRLRLRMMIWDMKWWCSLRVLRHGMRRQRLRMRMMIRDMKWWCRLRVLRHEGMM